MLMIIIIIIKLYNYEIIITTDQNGQSVYPFSEQIGPKTLPGGAGTNPYSIYKRVPPG